MERLWRDEEPAASSGEDGRFVVADRREGEKLAVTYVNSKVYELGYGDPGFEQCWTVYANHEYDVELRRYRFSTADQDCGTVG